MAPTLHGLHHVTAVTSNANSNLDFYTRVLGMRLVKQTVNQDDVSAYHLFYADALGSAGTELTFFDWKQVPRSRDGAGAVSESALRVVGGADALEQWARWFTENGVSHSGVEPATATRLPSLAFTDPEGQRLRLIAEPAGATEFHPWNAGLPVDSAIVGLSAVTITVRDFEPTARVLTEVLGFRVHPEDPTLFELGEGGPGNQIRVLTSNTIGTQGAGGVHHIAWRVPNVEAQHAWLKHLAEHGIRASGLIDRHYFQSVYFRIPGGILFEIATDGPGFTADGEELEHLGERLSLPPFLERSRAQIEAGLEPLQRVPKSDPGDPLGFVHRYIRGTNPDAPVLLLLHGTGGTENDLIELGRSLYPGASLLSPRGKVLENGLPRFFRRLAEGVFDEEDLVRRTGELADFVKAAAERYSFDSGKVIAVGYSNGANIAASLLLLKPGALAGAVLLRAMTPIEPSEQPRLTGVPVYLASGKHDSLVPTGSVERLATLLKEGGAEVTLQWSDSGHSLTSPELEAATMWLADLH